MNILRLRELFCPDFSAGILLRKIAAGRAKAGSIAGNPESQGYIRVSVDGKYEYVHRILWALYYDEEPISTIDHKDLNRSNNTISNLRLANYSQQGRNRNKPTHNTSGVKGVSFCKQSGYWRAEVKLNGKRVLDKRYPTIEEANDAAITARNQYHEEFVKH